MKVIVTLTVPEGKRLIAKAIAAMPEVRRARESGKILLKGGTTVSAVAEELAGVPMRISGRIGPSGLKAGGSERDAPHNMVIEGSEWRDAYQGSIELVGTLEAGDVVITGANVIDAYGGAAVMGGAPRGGSAGLMFAAVMAEGIPVIVAAGLEKLIPGTVHQAVMAAGRKGVDRSLGMAVGLIPIAGRVVTELEAVKLLAPVECQVIGKGGIGGAEGGVSLAIWGEEAAVDGIFRLVCGLKGATTSGTAESLVDCWGPLPKCRGHRACIYKSPKLAVRFGARMVGAPSVPDQLHSARPNGAE